jgi:hypothetical protein
MTRVTPWMARACLATARRCVEDGAREVAEALGLCLASDRVTLRIARAWAHHRARSARHAAHEVRAHQ